MFIKDKKKKTHLLWWEDLPRIPYILEFSLCCFKKSEEQSSSTKLALNQTEQQQHPSPTRAPNSSGISRCVLRWAVDQRAGEKHTARSAPGEAALTFSEHNWNVLLKILRLWNKNAQSAALCEDRPSFWASQTFYGSQNYRRAGSSDTVGLTKFKNPSGQPHSSVTVKWV